VVQLKGKQKYNSHSRSPLFSLYILPDTFASGKEGAGIWIGRLAAWVRCYDPGSLDKDCCWHVTWSFNAGSSSVIPLF
jgi:hypothetical protein